MTLAVGDKAPALTLPVSGGGELSLAKLKGKPVVVTSGTTNERAIKNYNLDESLNMRFVQVKDHNEALAALDNGSAAAFPMDDVLLYSMRATAKNPADYTVVGDFLTHEPYGIMIRKDDTAFKKVGDDTVKEMMKSGEMAKLWDKWFLQPIPPKNALVGLALSESTKQAWANPNDKPAEAYQKK